LVLHNPLKTVSILGLLLTDVLQLNVILVEVLNDANVVVTVHARGNLRAIISARCCFLVDNVLQCGLILLCIINTIV
jgi:hypothetical protein